MRTNNSWINQIYSILLALIYVCKIKQPWSLPNNHCPGACGACSLRELEQRSDPKSGDTLTKENASKRNRPDCLCWGSHSLWVGRHKKVTWRLPSKRHIALHYVAQTSCIIKKGPRISSHNGGKKRSSTRVMIVMMMMINNSAGDPSKRSSQQYHAANFVRGNHRAKQYKIVNSKRERHHDGRYYTAYSVRGKQHA